MAPHLVADLAKKRSTMARWPQLNGTLGISHPRGPKGCLRRRLLLHWGQLDGPPEGPHAPRSTGPKPAFPRKHFWTPHGSMRKWLQHEDEDSLIKRRWEPRIGT
jgi:hypothetical protein